MTDDAKDFNSIDNTYLYVRYLKRFIDKNQYQVMTRPHFVNKQPRSKMNDEGR